MQENMMANDSINNSNLNLIHQNLRHFVPRSESQPESQEIPVGLKHVFFKYN